MSGTFHVLADEILRNKAKMAQVSFDDISAAIDTCSAFNGGLTAGTLFELASKIDAFKIELDGVVSQTTELLGSMADQFRNMDASINY